MLIAGRAIQGVGGAIFPLAFGIIRDEFPREKVATGIALISATSASAAAPGIVLAGLIVDHLAYQWLFWLPLIVVVLAADRDLLFVPESPVQAPAQIDWGGAALLSGWLVVPAGRGQRGQLAGAGTSAGRSSVCSSLAVVLLVPSGSVSRRASRAARRHADDARPRRSGRRT